MKVIHVLLIDDDPDILELFGAQLRNEGLGVDTAGSAEEALEKLEHYYPELIIADVQMPGMSGFDLCRKLRETGKDEIPFFFCSARGSIPERVEGLRLGADDYLVKPVDPGELLFRVQAQLARNRAAREMRSNLSPTREQLLSGRLKEVDVSQILQFVDQGIEPGSYELRIRSSEGAKASVWVRERRIRQARIGEHFGQKALFRILQLREGTFELVSSSRARNEMLDEEISGILLDSLSQLDEYRLLRQSFDRQGNSLHVRYSDELFRTRFDKPMLVVLELVERHRELDAILDDSPYSDLITLRILTELLQIEFVTTEAPPTRGTMRE